MNTQVHNIFSQILKKLSSNVFKITLLSGLVSGARFLYMFYFSTIDKSNQKEVADLIFINGNNAVFISLFSTLVLIPLAQFKKYNFLGISSFILGSIIISLLWNLIYNYQFTIIWLMILVMLTNIFYETIRRVLFITNESLVITLDIIVCIIYLVILGIFAYLKMAIYNYFIITSAFIIVLCSIFFIKINKKIFTTTGFIQFFKLNHSGVGQSLLMFVAGNYIFQLVSFFGSSEIFTKVNIIRVWTTPVSLILNALDFVYSRDTYKGRVPKSLLLTTLFISGTLLLAIQNETLLYCMAFILIIPFQFWLRGLQIKLRQRILHNIIWKMNIYFTIFSILFSTIIVYFFNWKYWSWYIILVYLVIWIQWIRGNKKELT